MTNLNQSVMSQNQFVLNHLIDHGYITDVIARNYGIRRLASRMHDLKKAGVLFHVAYRTDDMGVRYALYTMPEAERVEERACRDNGGDWRAWPSAA